MGVSLTNDRHPANVIYNKNHLRYPLRVFPVNPKGGTLQREKVYPRIADIPEEVDLAVIAVRAEHVPDAVEACIKANVGGAVVISGGFAGSYGIHCRRSGFSPNRPQRPESGHV